MINNSDWIYTDNDRVVRLNVYYEMSISEFALKFQIKGYKKVSDTTFIDVLFEFDTKEEAENKLEEIAKKLGAKI